MSKNKSIYSKLGDKVGEIKDGVVLEVDRIEYIDEDNKNIYVDLLLKGANSSIRMNLPKSEFTYHGE